MLAGAAPGGKMVDFRPTSGPPSLLEAVILKTKKSSRDISPISPTKQEPTDGEVICMRTWPPLSRNSANLRAPTARYVLLALLMLCLAVRPPAGCPGGPGNAAPWGMPARERVPAARIHATTRQWRRGRSGVLSRGHAIAGVLPAGGPRPPDMLRCLLAYAMFNGLHAPEVGIHIQKQHDSLFPP